VNIDTVHCTHWRLSVYLSVAKNSTSLSDSALWTGTPIITLRKHRLKMYSRVAASIAYATGFGEQMVVNNITEYEGPWRKDFDSLWCHWKMVAVWRESGEFNDLRRNTF
jgi:protein O-GlcNAc transferase